MKRKNILLTILLSSVALPIIAQSKLNSKAGYAVEVLIPMVEINGNPALAFQLYAGGFTTGDITTYNQLNEPQQYIAGDNTYYAKQLFFAAPATEIILGAANEFANVQATGLGYVAVGATTGFVITEGNNLNKDKGRVWKISVPPTDTGEGSVVGGHHALSDARIISSITIRLLTDNTIQTKNQGTGIANSGSRVGLSGGNPILLQTVEDVFALQVLLDRELTTLTTADYNTIAFNHQNRSYSYLDCVNLFVSAGVDADSLKINNPTTVTTTEQININRFLAAAFYFIDGNITMPVGFVGLANPNRPFVGFMDGTMAQTSIEATLNITEEGNCNTGFIERMGHLTENYFCALRNVKIFGTIDITKSSAGDYYVGGLVGRASGESTFIKNCESRVTINVKHTATNIVSGLTNNIYAGGLVGQVEKAHIVASPSLRSGATDDEIVMDYRSKYEGLGAGVFARAESGVVMMGGAIGMMKDSYLSGVKVYFESGITKGDGKYGCYVGGVLGYFESNSETAIRGNSLTARTRFTLTASADGNGTDTTSATNPNEAVMGGVVGYINHKGGTTWVSLFNNVVDTDMNNEGGKGGTLIVTDWNSNSRVDLIAGGYYGKVNTPHSGIYFLASSGRTLLNGEFLVEAIQNGRCSDKRLTGYGNSSTDLTPDRGNIHVGGLFGRGFMHTYDLSGLAAGADTTVRMDNLRLRAVQKATTKNSVDNTDGQTKETTLAGEVCVGFAAGFVVKQDNTSNAFSHLTNLRIATNGSHIEVIREEGSEVVGTIAAGGFFGAISRYYNSGAFSAPNAKTDNAAKYQLNGVGLTMKNSSIKIDQLAFSSRPIHNASYTTEFPANKALILCGGFVGAAYNAVFNGCTVSGENSSVAVIQNARGGSDMCTSDAYMGGLVGLNFYGVVKDSRVWGKTTADDLKLTLVTNAGSNSPAFGGITGFGMGGLSTFQVDNTTTLIPTSGGLTLSTSGNGIAIVNSTVDRITIEGTSYNSTPAANCDILIGGLMGMVFNTSIGAADCAVTNSSITGFGRYNGIAKVGGLLGSTYNNATTSASPLLDRSISRNNRIVAQTQTQIAASGGIMGDIFSDNQYIRNCHSINDDIRAYSSGHRSVTGGLLGTKPASGNLTFESCFTNSKQTNNNPIPTNAIRGGLVGSRISSATPTYTNTYFHQQNAGIGYTDCSPTSPVAASINSRNLDFSNVVLSSAKPNVNIFNPTNGIALKESVAIITGYASELSYPDRTTPTVSHDWDYTTSWNLKRKTPITANSSIDTWLWITPWSGGTPYHFGTINAVVTFVDTMPTASEVKLFDEFNFDTEITTAATRTLTYTDSLKFSAYTLTGQEPDVAGNYKDGFHNVEWLFYDSDALGNCLTPAIEYGNLFEYAAIDPQNNTLKITATTSITSPRTLFVQAVDYLTKTEVSPLVRIDISPRYVTDIKIQPPYRTSVTTKGTATDRFVMNKGVTYSLSSVVTPADATLTGYSFSLLLDILTTGVTLTSNGILTLSSAASGTFSIIATSDGEKTDRNRAKDTCYFKIIAGNNITVTSLSPGGSAIYSGESPYLTMDETHRFEFTLTPQFGYDVYRGNKYESSTPGDTVYTGVPRNFSLKIGNEAPIEMIKDGVADFDSLSRYVHWTIGDMGNYSLKTDTLLTKFGSVDSVKIICDFFRVYPVTFDVQYPITHSYMVNAAEGTKASDYFADSLTFVALTTPPASQYKGLTNKGWLLNPLPTVTTTAQDFYHFKDSEPDPDRNSDKPIRRSTIWYAVWMNDIQFLVTHDVEADYVVPFKEIKTPIEPDNAQLTTQRVRYTKARMVEPEEAIVSMDHLVKVDQRPLSSKMDLNFKVYVDKNIPKPNNVMVYIGNNYNADGTLESVGKQLTHQYRGSGTEPVKNMDSSDGTETLMYYHAFFVSAALLNDYISANFNGRIDIVVDNKWRTSYAYIGDKPMDTPELPQDTLLHEGQPLTNPMPTMPEYLLVGWKSDSIPSDSVTLRDAKMGIVSFHAPPNEVVLTGQWGVAQVTNPIPKDSIYLSLQGAFDDVVMGDTLRLLVDRTESVVTNDTAFYDSFYNGARNKIKGWLRLDTVANITLLDTLKAQRISLDVETFGSKARIDFNYKNSVVEADTAHLDLMLPKDSIYGWYPIVLPFHAKMYEVRRADTNQPIRHPQEFGITEFNGLRRASFGVTNSPLNPKNDWLYIDASTHGQVDNTSIMQAHLPYMARTSFISPLRFYAAKTHPSEPILFGDAVSSSVYGFTSTTENAARNSGWNYVAQPMTVCAEITNHPTGSTFIQASKTTTFSSDREEHRTNTKSYMAIDISTSSPVISPYTAFFYQANANGVFEFEKSEAQPDVRSAPSDKKQQSNATYHRLHLKDDNTYDALFVSVSPDSTATEYELGRDVLKMGGLHADELQLWSSKKGNTLCVINGHLENGTAEIPIQMNLPEKKTYHLSVEQSPNDESTLWLMENNKPVCNLSQTKSHAIDAESSSHNSYSLLIVNTKTEQGNPIRIYSEKLRITIVGINVGTSYSVVNTAGLTVAKGVATDHEIQVQTPIEGIYVVSIGNTIKKVAVSK